LPIVLRHNEILEFSRVEYHGAIRAEDLHNHAAFNADNPIWLGFDCISVIHADLDIAEISLANLDGVFNAHRQAVRAARVSCSCAAPAGFARTPLVSVC
jgi:hypothetical protein